MVEYNKMSIEVELKALRYLVNNLILYTYGLHVKLDSLLNDTAREYSVAEPNVNGNDVAFDLFSIPKKRYEELIEQYGVDIVTKACAKLDEFVKINEYIPYRTAYNSLKQKFIKDELFEREQKHKEIISKNKEEVPEHLRGL